MTELLAQVQAVIEADVRPLIQQHGGDIQLIKIEDNKVYVSLKGACVGCPFSFYTMLHGVQTRLQEKFPAIAEVVSV